MKRVRNKFKSIFICLCLGITMLFSGLFFVGCGDNPVDKLTLTADKSVVEVYAGESENITFTIGNYTNGIDTSLSFSLADSTVSSTKSEHAELEVLSHEGTKTTVKITGVSGGTTTLIANTNEGNKKASVSIVVKQYSSKFGLKSDSLLYVSKDTAFIPSEKLFVFDESATERKVSFHFTDAVSNANDNNAFVKAELVKDDESDAYSVVFYQSDGHIVALDDYKNVLEGTGIGIVAKYYNPLLDKTESVQFSLTVLYGFEKDVKIEAYDVEGEEVEKIELVANDPSSEIENWRSKKFKVKVPHVENIEGGENVKFKADSEKNGLISVQKVKNEEESTSDYDIYDFEIVSTTVASSETYVKLRLYYEIDGISYAESGDPSVEQSLTVPVIVRVAPLKIVVNSTEQHSADNQYDFYNYYDGEYGWKEFKVDVYASDSSFDYVSMTFEDDLIVKYKGVSYVAGVTAYELKIDDVSQPIYIRGASNAAETTKPKQVTFEVVSKYARETVSYSCNYSILTGATGLAFDNPNTGYEYNSKQDETGIFISSSNSEAVFEHLIADNDFKYANVTLYEENDGESLAARVAYDGKEDSDLGEFKKIVKLKIYPLKAGIVTYKVSLDNGVYKLITIRVVDTFDNFSVNLAGYGNDGVQSAEKKETPETGFSDEMHIVIQNTTQKTDQKTIVTFGKTAKIVLGSAKGNSVFEEIGYWLSDSGVVTIAKDNETTFSLTTIDKGCGYINFSAEGTNVEDFKKVTIMRKVKVNFTSCVPVYSLSVQDENGANANNVSLYVGNVVSDEKLQTAKFSVSVDPASEAYGFFDPTEDKMENASYDEKYIYWTVNYANAYSVVSNESASRMVFGKTYKIGLDPYNYFGTFDTSTNTFTINKDMMSTFSFTMFASIRQYGTSKYFSVTINGENYDFVERIFTNLGENSIKFSPSNTTFDIGAFLNPSNATDTKVIARFVNKNTSDEDPLLLTDLDKNNILSEANIYKISGGVNSVKINLNQEILNKEIKGKLSGELQIIPNAWYVDGSIISGYENSIVKISIAYENGTEENPFSLSSAEDVIAIGNGDNARSSHYKISTTIDMSGYSNKLPLGEFSGSIVGEGDASIIGINIKNGVDGYYGLFKSVSGKIENLTIKGSANIESKASAIVGLLCAELKEGAMLNNISVYISGGNVSVGEAVFGGIVGINNGTITNMCVVYEDYVNILSSLKSVKAGGIAGISNGTIAGRDDTSKRFGVSAYSVYALIRVGDITKIVSDYGQAAAVAAVQTGGEITNILAGGVIFAKNASGLVETFTENEQTTIENLTIRSQVRGQEVGLVAVNAKSKSIRGFNNITIQAIEDGESTGIYASIYAKIKEKIEENDIPKENGEIKLARLLFANSQFSPDVVCETYVNRTKIELNQAINNKFTLDQYFGDVIFVSTSDASGNGLVKATYSFENQKSVTFAVDANEVNGFKQLTSSDEHDATKVIFAYYFDAAGYYAQNGYVTEEVYKAQEILDQLNHVKSGDRFYPISVLGTDVSISSNSPKVEVSVSGDLYIKGTGIAELEIKSLLNKKQNEKVYLYIINYFNVKSYIDGVEKGIFTLGDLVLGENSKFNVYSKAGVDILISPSYKNDNFELEVDDGILDVNISSSGLVKIGNDLIQLKKNRDISALIEGEMNYGSATPSRDGISFSKQGKAENGECDEITLKAVLSQVVDGKTYSLDIYTLENVEIDYYEGAQDVKTLYENYPLSSSMTVIDTYLIDSDDINDEIEVDKCKFVDAKTGEKVNLFKLELKKTSDDLTYTAQISVNKDSTEFKNRFNDNIYKSYILKLKANSNEQFIKEIPITLVQENIDVIAFTNYKIISSTNSEGNTIFGLEEYNNIIPGTRGILSVALSPVDADFDYLQITNNDMNSLEGASQGTFVLGKWGQNGFEQIQGTESINGGIRISKANLEKAFGTGFIGQVYVRYIFSNVDVKDGASVGINITVLQGDGSISRIAKYNFYKKDDVSVTLKGYTNKQCVARGLEYELDVKTIGYDAETISLTSNKPQQAAIIERDGVYYLKITDDPIDYGENKGLDFELTLSASKSDDFGNLETETNTLKLTILEYVINFDNTLSQDVISGVENGVLNVAVGDKNQLKVSFDGLIEYNKDNLNVQAMVNSFLDELSMNGTWNIYTDLNINNASGESSKQLPISEKNSTKSIISAEHDLNIKYLKISNLSLVALQSHDPQTTRRYFFTYDAKYSIINGRYKYEANGNYSINSKFDVYSYMRGSEESPNPITNYKEFLGMEQGGYYIQLADIHVPSEEFVPLNTAIKYFDGNSYKFIFDDEKYLLGDASSIGLFGTLSASSIVKNLTIQIGSDKVDYVEFNSESTSAINFGFVAGTNNGVITNANIINGGVSAFLTFKNTPAVEGYYFGGIVGQNSGYLTHSQVSLSIESCISMGGLVGTNQGKIASSLFKGGKLLNTSIYNDVFGVGGLVSVNSENAVIITSYSSGNIVSDRLYADYDKNDEKSSVLNSSVPVGGFVYLNDGEIRDCYSNIPLVTTSRSAGFAFNNNGKIVRSFSTSKITNDNSATNYYFSGEGTGTFENCYYITGNKINKTLSPLSHEGVEPLIYNEEGDAVSQNDFENLTEKFDDYSYALSPSYNSVWFYSGGGVSTVFPSQKFASGRLELTSANIIATSKKEHVKTNINSDGIATYIYATASDGVDDGSVFNPYVIYSPETMESYFVTNNKVASKNYRLVCPVDYSSFVSDYSNLYKVNLKGNFEANDMTISGITLSSNEQCDYAGLFGSVVGSSDGVNASIMNLNLVPKEVIFNNAAEVGALAGRIQNANIYNINVYGASAGDDVDVDDELETVTGKNIVGGIIGLAKDGYSIKNVRSLIGAFAANVPYDKSEVDYEKENSDYNNLSFAGGVVGYLAGSGSVKNSVVERAAINIIGGKAGFVFGGIASDVDADSVYLKVNSSMKMKPYRYGGFIAGEVKGKLKNAYVYGYESTTAGTEEIFALKPYIANAIGGIAGLLNGGEIDTAYISQGLAVENQSAIPVDANAIDALGGIVGLVKGKGNKISKVLATGDLLAKNTLGGIVGRVEDGSTLTISEAAFKANDLTLDGQNAMPSVGGLVGAVGKNAVLNVSNSYCLANITIKTYTYSTQIDVKFGGIIGGVASSDEGAATIRLENIYTTSIYNITVEDKSSTDAAGMVYDGWVASDNSGEGSRDYSVGGYYLDGYGKVGGEIGSTTDSETDEKKEQIERENKLRQINYSLNQTTLSCTNVYNSSIKGCSAPIMDRGYTTLYARKFANTPINVMQNEYGIDLYNLISDELINDTNLLTNIEYTIGVAFNNMFGGNGLWRTSETANSYLAFEEALELGIQS